MDYEINLHDLLAGDSKKKKKDTWDNYVPIASVDNVYNIYLSSDIASPDEYDEMCFLLDTLTDSHYVDLHINTPGGSIDSAFKIVDAIRRCSARTTARLTGTVASAGTIIALSCNDMVVADHTHFMIHNYSTGAQGKGHELMEYINFNDRTLQKTFKDIYKGFLTDEEIESVIRGKDLWLDSDEVKARRSHMKAPKAY